MSNTERDYWKYNDWTDDFICPICGNRYDRSDMLYKGGFRFCPNCGARLYNPLKKEEK